MPAPTGPIHSAGVAAQAAPLAATSPTTHDACSIVTAADIAATTGIHVGAGTATDSYLQGTTCTFASADNATVIVQTSPKPDEYLQEAKFEAMYDDVHELDVASDRGFVAAPNEVGVGHVLVVKNGFGVDVSVAAHSGYGVVQEQALASLVASRL